MCGIAGSFIQKNNNLDLKMALTDVIKNLKHRGPDVQTVFDLGEIQLAHSRLSILDLNPRSNQPMGSPDRRFWIVLNGEIYNFLELRNELIDLGVKFHTTSDTEVLLYAWCEWGTDCLAKLTGMYAFAVWDTQQKQLFLVRDRMGEKPLFYYHANHHSVLLFASELTALLQHPLVSKTIDYQAVNQYLSLNYILTNSCILQNFHKVPPAHYMVFKQGETPKTICYWNLAEYYQKPKLNYTFAEAKENFSSLLRETVQQQTRSDVPLGVFLSGGLDSSTIVAAVNQQQQPQTFSIDFKETSYSEVKHSQDVANHLGVEHFVEEVFINEPSQIIRTLATLDEPFADSSLIPCYYLAEYTKKFVTVALSGDGGDELFAGYETYLANRYKSYLSFLPKPFVSLLSRTVEKIYPSTFEKVSTDYKIKQFLKGLQYNYQRAHFTWREIFTSAEKTQLCKSELSQQFKTDPSVDFCQYFSDVEDCAPLDQFLYVDMKTWLPDDILVKVDRTSMAHALEVRAPFLNHKIVEFAAQLPCHYKLKGRETKHFLKQSQSNILPADIIYRKKQGFNAPISNWLLSPKMQTFTKEMLFSERMQSIFNENYINTLYNQHITKQKDQGLKLFGLIELAYWFNTHLG